jgi:CheY-like chemotaxis protein/anti-sigma regulatory factor (Ser/Thr protein kinase)
VSDALPSPHPTTDGPPPTVLIVDDASVDRLVAGRVAVKHGWRVLYAKSGDEALEAMSKSVPSAVVTDLQMPGVDGLALVEQIHDRYPRVPVVLMTGQGSEELAVAALRAGAASYVAKRNLAVDLPDTLAQVLAASRTDDQQQQLRGCLSRRLTRYVLVSNPALVGPLVATLRDELTAFGVCDTGAATRCGIALEEALLNAVYHGNLGVSSALKLEDDTAFHRLAAERQKQAPYKDRKVRVITRLSHEQATFVITDEGPGFDVSKLPDPTDPMNMLLPSGRGVVLMRMFMDEVTYNATGNRVTLVKRKTRAEAPSEA